MLVYVSEIMCRREQMGNVTIHRRIGSEHRIKYSVPVSPVSPRISPYLHCLMDEQFKRLAGVRIHEAIQSPGRYENVVPTKLLRQVMIKPVERAIRNHAYTVNVGTIGATRQTWIIKKIVVPYDFAVACNGHDVSSIAFNVEH